MRSNQTAWGPLPLGDEVAGQLEQHGFGPGDAEKCARQLHEAVGTAARASLIVDLGSCRFLAGDVAGGLASWRQALSSDQTVPGARASFNVGLLHESLGLLGESAAVFGAMIDRGVEPWRSRAVIAGARVAAADGRTDRALGMLSGLAEHLLINRNDSQLLTETLLGAGLISADLRDLGHAEQSLRAALAHAQGDDVARVAVELVRVLRSVGHHDEADALIDDHDLAKVVPEFAIDRLDSLAQRELLAEAGELAAAVAGDQLTLTDRFRFVAVLVALGEAERAVDELEALSDHDSIETRARAAFELARLYADHDMDEQSTSMLEMVYRSGSSQWADRAALLIGDRRLVAGHRAEAVEAWADAAASRIASVAIQARRRLVDGTPLPLYVAPVADSAAPARRGVELPPEEIEAVDDVDEAPEPTIIVLRRRDVEATDAKDQGSVPKVDDDRAQAHDGDGSQVRDDGAVDGGTGRFVNEVAGAAMNRVPRWRDDPAPVDDGRDAIDPDDQIAAVQVFDLRSRA